MQNGRIMERDEMVWEVPRNQLLIVLKDEGQKLLFAGLAGRTQHLMHDVQRGLTYPFISL
jgi:hypothetical protein